MVSYRDLVSARPELLEEAAHVWDGLRVRFAEQIYGYTLDVHDRVHDGVSWTGAAADAARESMSRTGRRLLATQEYLTAQGALLREAATGIRDCQYEVTEAGATARSFGLALDADGRVVMPPLVNQHNATLNQDALAEHQQRQRVADQVTSRIGAAVARATAWDAQIAARLRMPELFDAVAEGGDWWSPAAAVRTADGRVLSDFEAAGLPAHGSDPAAVKEYWDQLSPAERERLIHEHPDLVGSLDGVPCVARDAANRLTLESVLARTRAEIAAVGPEPPKRVVAGRGTVVNPEWTRWQEQLAPLRDRLAGLEAVHKRLYEQNTDSADPHHAYLLGLNTAGRGQAIVAVGNPDTAANVITYVPGTGSHLGNIGGDIDRSDRMVNAADRASQSHATASITWVGYDAPAQIPDAASTDYAKNAEPALQRFETGLRVTHEGAPAHSTVIGHSYGTTTVGFAMRDGGLPVDDVIFVGSPGVGVDHASDLGIDPGHVYSGTAANDPIQLARTDPSNPAYPAGAVALAGTPLGIPMAAAGLADLVTGSDPQYVFGRDPVSPDFGGRIIPTDPGTPIMDGGAHSEYWNRGSASLRAIGQVAVGQAPHD